MSFSIYPKEITDENGKICHTVKIDESMVEFVMIKGVSVLLYKDSNMREALMRLKNKTFAQYLDRVGKNIKVRVSDGINPPAEGWITRFQIYENKGIFAFFYGEPFRMEDEGTEAVKDIELDQIVWIIKDVTKLYYQPTPESDYKYEIYFGLKLEVKKQRGDYYFVMIYNSILQEYRPGWVKIEDTGTFEYFLKEYERRREEYDKEIRLLDRKIAEQQKIYDNIKKDISSQEKKKDEYYSQKYMRLQKIDDLKAKKRERMNEEQRMRLDKIEELKTSIADLDTLSMSLDVDIKDLENFLSKVKTEVEDEEIKITVYREVLKDLKSGKMDVAEAIDEVSATKGDLGEVEESLSQKIIIAQPDDEEEDPCRTLKGDLASKMTDFEEVRNKMGGPLSKEEYDMYYEVYLSIWSEIGELKKEVAECETYSKNKHIALYNEALKQKKNYDYDQALELLIEAVEYKPDFDEGYYQIVLVLIELDDDSSIDKYIEKISDPQKKGVAYSRRASAVKDRYPEKAINYYEKMAKNYKPDLAFYYIGLIYLEKLSDSNNGIKYLKKSVEINYEDPRTLEALGAAYMELKPPKGQTRDEYVNQAVDYFEKAFRNAEGYRNIDVLSARLSQAYNTLGKATSADKYADIALENTRQNPFGLAHLEKAKALIKMDRKSEARKHLKQAAKDLSVKTQAEYWLKELEK
jgi:tetratricopeptide (TPR) repeat protein